MYVLAVDTDSETIYPADRCTWKIRFNTDSGEYEIFDARFYDGNDDGGSAITGTPIVFGHIGKQGRFVPITKQ